MRQSLAGALLLVLLAAAPAAAAVGDVPKPAADRWPTTLLALLRHAQGRCDGVATGLDKHWQGLSGSDRQQQDALDAFLLRHANAEMTGARAALDVVRRFLPELRFHADGEVAAVIETLLDLDNGLCGAVAQPTPPRARFRERLDEIHDAIATKETELGRLLLVPPEVLVKGLSEDLEPYLAAIDEASHEAEKEYQGYLESQKPKEKPVTVADRMREWHARYTDRVRPSKVALSQYLLARKANDGAAIAKACREILTQVIPLLDDPILVNMPDPEVSDPLVQTYRQMRTMAGHCTSGNYRDLDRAWRAMQDELAQATAILAKYSLKP